jgi:hypothetical protein
MAREYGLGLRGSAYGPMAAPCEYGNGTGFRKCRTFLDQLSNY